MTEHRWRDISGPDVTDDPDWRGLRTLPTFGGGGPASLEAGEVRALAPRASALMVWWELYDGQGVSAAPVSPTPAVTLTLELVTQTKDSAGNNVYSVGPAVSLLANQRRAIEAEVDEQGLHWVRIRNIAGATTDPGSIRVFAAEAVAT